MNQDFKKMCTKEKKQGAGRDDVNSGEIWWNTGLEWKVWDFGTDLGGEILVPFCFHVILMTMMKAYHPT